MYPCLLAATLVGFSGRIFSQSEKTDTSKRVKVIIKDEAFEAPIATEPIHFRWEDRESLPKGIRVPAPAIPATMPPLNHWTSARSFPCDTCLVWVMDPKKPLDSATAYRLIVNPRVFEFRFREEHEADQGWNRDDERLPGVAEPLVRRSVFAVGFTGLRNEFTNGPRVPELNTSKSVSCYLGLFEGGLKLDRAGRLRIWSGAGYEWDNYRFENPAVRLSVVDTFSPLGSTTQHFSIDSTQACKKSKLVGQYLTIPLMIGIHSSEDADEQLNVLVGCHIGYRLRSHAKYMFENDGREKWRNSFQMNDWKVSPYIEVGYNRFRVYAKYNMNPLFRQNGGNPAAQQFTIGLLTTFS
ncbi:MAG: hypothetical protein RL160_811 [Bacteroidota bacterium]